MASKKVISVDFGASISTTAVTTVTTGSRQFCWPPKVSTGTMVSTTTTGSLMFGSGFSTGGNWTSFDIPDKDRMKIAQGRRIKLDNPFLDGERVVEMSGGDKSLVVSETVCYDEDKEPSGYGRVNSAGSWVNMEDSEYIEGPNIISLSYIGNSTLSTLLFLLGYFETVSISNKLISRVLDKKTEELIQNT